MREHTTRRRTLKAAATGVGTVLLAGCTDFGSNGDSDDDSMEDEESMEDDSMDNESMEDEDSMEDDSMDNESMDDDESMDDEG